MKKLLSVLLVCMMLLTLLLSGCGGNNNRGNTTNGNDQNASGDTDAGGEIDYDYDLVIAIPRDPSTLNPGGSQVGYDGMIRFNMYECLLTFDEDNNIIPSLATSYEWVDDVTLRFYLRDDVYFHNGAHMTAEDVMYSLERNQAAEAAGGQLDSIDFSKSSIIDEYTVELVLSEPFAPILGTLADSFFSLIVCKEYTEANGPDIGDAPCGTGPFEFVERVYGDHITLKRFDNYWGDKAQVATVTFRVIPENSTRFIELETGGVDIACQVAATDAVKLNEGSVEGCVRFPVVLPSTGAIQINCGVKPLDDVRVRQAMRYALDVEAIVDAVYLGLYDTSYGAYNKNLPFYFDDYDKYYQDQEKAKELLAEAGYADGFEVELLISNDNELVTMAEMVKAQFAEVGITLTIATNDAATVTSRHYSGDFEMLYQTWGTSNADVDVCLYSQFHSSFYPYSSCIENEELDALLDEGRMTVDNDARAEIYKEAQILLNELSPWIYMDELIYSDGVRDYVQGWNHIANMQSWIQSVSVLKH